MSEKDMSDFDKIMKIIEKNVSNKDDAPEITDEMKNISQKFVEDAQNTIITATSNADDPAAGEALVTLKANLTFDITEVIVNFEDEAPSEQIEHLKKATQDLLMKMQVGMQDQFKNMMF